jgi:hypothetical protein
VVQHPAAQEPKPQGRALEKWFFFIVPANYLQTAPAWKGKRSLSGNVEGSLHIGPEKKTRD